jgi:iron complex outermembrane receptor protein
VARGGRLGLLGQTDVMDAPFNISSYTAQAIEDRQATTLGDALALDPSVRSTAPNGDVADAFFVRGFAMGDNNIGEVAFDGLYGVAPNYRLLTDYAERIEVLKGPAAMLYGMSPNSGIGGGINIVPKRAGADLTRLRMDYASRSQGGGHIDVARRFGEAREFGVRFNGSYRDGDTPIDHQSRQATLGALALDYTSGGTTVTLDLIHQREKVDAPSRRPLLASGLAVPAAPDGRRNITQRWEWYDSTEKSALLRVQHEVNSQLAWFASYGAARSDVDRLFNTPTIFNAAGDTRVTPARARFHIERSTAEAGLRARFATGAVAHEATLQWSGYRDRYYMGSNAGAAYVSNIYSPLDAPAQDVAAPGAVPQRSSNRLGGVALSDTLRLLDDRLLVVLGLRHQQVDSDNFGTDGSLASTYRKSAVTPMAGLVLKPWQGVSLYGNYIEGLSKGDTAPNTASNAGEIFAPYKAKQQEVGVKLDNGRVLTTLSLFQIKKPSGFLQDNRFDVNGEQRNRGLELSMYGTPGDGWRLYGGVTWMDAKLISTNSATTTGRTAVGVPRTQVALNVERDLQALPGLTATAGLVYNSAQFADQANTQRLPAWSTVDLGLRYRLQLAGKTTTLRAAVRNAGDRRYWAGSSTWGTLLVGAPRSVLMSATVDF